MKNKLYKVLGVVLSITLVLTAIFCLPAVAEDVVDEATTVDYYVQSPGYAVLEAEGYADSTDKGAGTLENPAHTVADLIGIIGDSLTANDTANVYIMQREDWAANNGTKIGDYTAEDGTAVTDNSPRSSITAWSYNGGALPSHDYTLVLRSPDTQEEQSFLAYTTYIGRSADMVLGGPTVFENVTLLDTQTNNDCSVSHGGHDVSFGESTKFHFIAKIYSSNSAAWTGATTFRDSWPIRYGYSKAVGGDGKGNFGATTITIKSPIIPGNSTWQAKRRLFLGIGQGSNTTIKGDVTIILDNENMELPINWGNNANNWNKPTFQKTLNFNIKSAKSVSHNLYVASGTTYYNGIVVTGGLQAIVPEGFEFDPTLIGPANKEGTNYRDCVVSNGGRYIIERISDDPEIIDFAKDADGNIIAGTYTIKDGYTATATTDIIEATVDATTGEYTKTVTDTVTNVSENGLLTVPAGETTVTFERVAVTKDYYVRSPGWEDLDDGEYAVGLGTKESPAATVKDVIDIINADGLVAGDTANVYIMNHSDVGNSESLKYDGSVIGIDKSSGSNVYYIPYHSLTSWQHTTKNVSTGGSAPAAHTFNLVIKPDPEATETVYLAYADTIGNGYLTLSGPTVFEGVTIVSPRSYWNSVVANGNDITYGENCKFGAISVDYSKDYSAGNTWDGKVTGFNALNTYLLSDTNDLTFDGMNVEISTKYASSYARNLYMGKGIKAATFTGDYNLTIDHASASPDFYWGNTATTSTLALTNLNIHVKQGALDNVVANDATTNVMTADAVQVIAENAATVNNLETVLAAKNLTNYWYIKNGGDAGIISFRRGEDGNAIAGTFTVAEGYDVTAVNTSTAEEVTSANGVLDLTGKPGSYTLVFKDAQTNNYSDYINVRNGLGNTYSKLTKDKELNVVYFGGSVTSGSGSSNSSLYSWRGRVGNWLTTNFPAANISNIKQSIGETGTYLGCYRVARDVVSKAPDLLFIEYSINDYYDHASYDRAQMQFETVVREVKTAYPDCDIVTILVTDYGNISTARANKLHTQAKAHEDICVEYNIPSIYVGNALAAALGEDWTKQSNYEDDAVWLQYVKDIVHPLDAGYEIYFNVIKEFLNNELNYGEYDGTITTNPMPEIQNKYKYLFDGDITYIDESTVEFTTEGGTTYDPDSEGIVSKDDYQGLIFVPKGSTDTVTVNFTGTELIMVTTGGHGSTATITTTDSAYTEADDVDSETDGIQIKVANTYEVSLDGGATWETRQYEGKNPILIASGLPAGEHTAIIRPSSYTQVRIAGFYSRDVEKSSNILDITDLVNADIQIAASTTTAYYDYNNDDVINAKDVVTVKKILLNNK